MRRSENFDDVETLQERETSDAKTIRINENKSDPADLCNYYTWSIIFCIIFSVAALVWIYVYLQLIKKKKVNLTGLEIIFIFLGLSTLVQFGPMLSTAIHAGHGVFFYSQTGCKLMFFTEYGGRHVISFLVVSLYIYLHIGMRFGFESIDRKLRDNVGWMVVLIMAVEGLFGMVPAMYVDVSVKENLRTRCIYSQTMTIGFHQVTSMVLILRSLTPYVFPWLGVLISEVWFSFTSASSLLHLQRREHELQPAVRSRLAIVPAILVTFFSMNMPFAVIILTEFGLALNGHSYSIEALCNIKAFLVVLHQLWFLVAPLIFIIKEQGDNSFLLNVRKRLKQNKSQNDEGESS